MVTSNMSDSLLWATISEVINGRLLTGLSTALRRDTDQRESLVDH